MTSPIDDPSDEHAPAGPSILAAVGRAFGASEGSPPGSPPLSGGADRPPGDRASLLRTLLSDPEPESRREAAQALAASGPGTSLSALGRALGDPDDGVRAAAVRAASVEGQRSARLILPLTVARTWPMAQLAALEAAPRLVPGIGDRDLAELSASIGELDPPPSGHEQEAFGAIARAIGSRRLAGLLPSGGPSGIGAARLLLADGSPGSLQALARRAPRSTGEPGGASAAPIDLAPMPGRHGGSPTAAEPGEVPSDELIASLARALIDPAQAVRGHALASLSSAPAGMVAGWAEQALTEGTAAAAATAAAAVSALAIASCAGPILIRGAASPSDATSPFLRALSSLELPPMDMVGLVLATPTSLRPTAAQLVSRIGGRTVVGLMGPLLEDSAGAVRMAVLDLFAESGDPTGIALVAEHAANDASAAVRASALRALARAGSPWRVAAIARALEDPDPDVRATAAEALAPGASDAESALCLHALEDEDDRVWRATLHRIEQLPDSYDAELWEVVEGAQDAKVEEVVAAIESWGPDRLAALATAHMKSPHPAGRALAVELAARAGTPAAAAAVSAALDDPHPVVRRTAATALSTLRSPGAVTALARSLFDPQAEVRVEAVRALGVIDDDTVPGILISALKDPEVRVRNMAAEALTRWRSPAVARRLVAALDSPDLRRATGEVLRAMGESAVEPLVEAAASGEPGTSAAAGTILGAIAGPERFMSGLDSIDPADRLLAVRVLGVIGGPVAFEGLLSALADPDASVRTGAVVLLGALGDARAIKGLRRVFLGDPLADVASAAEAALHALGSVPPASDDVVVLDEDRLDIPDPRSDHPS